MSLADIKKVFSHLARAMINICKKDDKLFCDVECEWYGQLYCSGDIIIDLYRCHLKHELEK